MWCRYLSRFSFARAIVHYASAYTRFPSVSSRELARKTRKTTPLENTERAENITCNNTINKSGVSKWTEPGEREGTHIEAQRRTTPLFARVLEKGVPPRRINVTHRSQKDKGLSAF